MELPEVLALLDEITTVESRGAATIVSASPRRQKDRAPFLGNREMAAIRDLASAIGTDHQLALALWNVATSRARLLATMIADPGSSPPTLLRKWAECCDNHLLAESLSFLAARSPHARELSDHLRSSTADHTSQVAWNLVSVLTRVHQPSDPTLPDQWFLDVLYEVESTMGDREPWTRHAMNMALCAIAAARPALQEQVLHVAASTEAHQVDLGQWNIPSPSPTAYVQNLMLRSARNAAMRRRLDRRRRT